ncbi:predicted protein [Sclerotinia sclerotiorum 1980 UF-70]|uniref:Uncharacterized protein n=1 Tax=Sclerotinia sclerotiorum (strain ATCC 18683 / 1980 / Ss-1) TaxID=665079 RepID=A7EAJ5_SCLS1|nr:predicted protein [Sclerotinia sclerotiorum 1980 UF-70]EDN99473.1 predicted protein [Sclerotinia sclerotiorum 1980 UF-70]
MCTCGVDDFLPTDVTGAHPGRPGEKEVMGFFGHGVIGNYLPKEGKIFNVYEGLCRDAYFSVNWIEALRNFLPQNQIFIELRQQIPLIMPTLGSSDTSTSFGRPTVGLAFLPLWDVEECGVGTDMA